MDSLDYQSKEIISIGSAQNTKIPKKSLEVS